MNVLPGPTLTKRSLFSTTGLQRPSHPNTFCRVTAGTHTTVIYKAWTKASKTYTVFSVSMRDNPQDPQAPMSAGACVPLISDGSLHLMCVHLHILLFTLQTASRYLEHVTQCKHCVRGCCVMLGERCIKGLYVFGIDADFFSRMFLSFCWWWNQWQ